MAAIGLGSTPSANGPPQSMARCMSCDAPTRPPAAAALFIPIETSDKGAGGCGRMNNGHQHPRPARCALLPPAPLPVLPPALLPCALCPSPAPPLLSSLPCVLSRVSLPAPPPVPARQQLNAAEAEQPHQHHYKPAPAPLAPPAPAPAHQQQQQLEAAAAPCACCSTSTSSTRSTRSSSTNISTSTSTSSTNSTASSTSTSTRGMHGGGWGCTRYPPGTAVGRPPWTVGSPA